jgi:subtilisin-like proprotein convertase family protein
MKRKLLAFISITSLLLQSAAAQVLFTTTNDFVGWNDNHGGTLFILTPVTSHDSDGGTTNGAGNWVNYFDDAGAPGTPGSLQVQWLPAAGNYGYIYGPPNQALDTNFLAVLEQTGRILTFDYTTPTNMGGNYFNPLGIVVNASSGFDQLSPTSTTPLGNSWTRATFGTWSNEAAKLAAHGTFTNGYFEIGVIWNSNYSPTGVPFYVDNFILRTPPPPPPVPVVLYTTTSDFTGWTTEAGVSSVGPTTFDLDGDRTNGVGNTSAPGALGTGGSLAVQWASNNFIQPFSYGPQEATNTAFITALEQATSLTFDYTTPPQGSGTYFELGILVNCNGRFDALFPTATAALSNSVTQATIGWTTEAGAILNAQRVSTNSLYLQIGLIYNSDYASTNTFYVDDIAVITNTPTANIIGTVTLVAQSCTPTNGTVNPGEEDTVDLVLQNIGNADASNVVATLLATGGVTSPSGAQSYGTLLAGGATVTNSFTFTATGACGGPLVATMQLQTNSVSAGTILTPFTLGTLSPVLTNTYSSGGISVPIPDHGTNTASITVTDTSVVQHVTISIRMNHNYDGDLTLNLIANGLTNTLLSYNPENSGQNFGSGATDCTGTFTIFDDSAATSIDSGSAPYDGSFKPEQPLATFVGGPSQGTWTLQVIDTDATSGDTGTLYCVQLNIAEQSYQCCSVPSGPSFTTWQDNYFTSAELGTPSFSGPNADPLGKGISNTNQFLAGFNPTNSAAYPHIISITKTNTADIKVTYLGASGDITYPAGPTSRTNVLEYTTGTGNGSYTNNFISTGQTNILSGGSGLGAVTTATDSGGATNKPSRYYRVRVLVP